jgi:hypothetical protein
VNLSPVRWLHPVVVAGVAVMSQAFAQSARDVGALPPETLLVKGAWSSASDSVTPVPEAGTVGGRCHVVQFVFTGRDTALWSLRSTNIDSIRFPSGS